MSQVSLPNPLEETRRPARARSERIFGGYNTSDAYSMAFDEMFDAQGNVRGPYKGIYAELAPSDASELKARAEALARAFIDQGITFSLSGQERPFPLDLVPRVISAAEWNRLERGITQRVKALEMYLDDIYGDQEILARRPHPPPLDNLLRALSPPGRGHRPTQRRANPRRGHRLDPR